MDWIKTIARRDYEHFSYLVGLMLEVWRYTSGLQAACMTQYTMDKDLTYARSPLLIAY